MNNALLAFTLLAALVVGSVPLHASEPPALRLENAIILMIEDPAPDFGAFADEWAAPGVVNSVGRAAVLAELRTLHRRLHDREQLDVMLDEGGVLRLEYGAPGKPSHWLHCQMQTEPPHRILRLWIEEDEPTESEPLTWETLSERLDAEAQRGFTGAVLVVRDGEVVVDRGYGMASREEGFPNVPGTIFAIGSAPIDFTFAGIMLLQEEGKLAYADPITKYFDNVPSDKRSITLEHLMTGRSGLQNFHDIPSDRDPDHSWISRDEAMRRIFAGKLLFEPGTGREHSHSAWGVLAAVIEIVSGQSYQEFTNERIFEPLGMRDTGFHGDQTPPERTAIGYGVRSDGSTNAAPFWGTTSWLVMGSGGQVSTTGDMGRFIEAMTGDGFLNEDNAALFRRNSRGLLNGGNAYGFEIYYTYTPGTYLVLLANAVDMNTRRPVADLARAIGDLVRQSDAPPFTLGVQIGFEDGRLVLVDVVEGSAADGAGLRPGDVLLGIGGKPFGEDLSEMLRPYLESGGAIPLDVEQDGQRARVTLKPRRRGN